MHDKIYVRTGTLFAGGREDDLGIFGACHDIVGQIKNQNSYLKVRRDCLFSCTFIGNPRLSASCPTKMSMVAAKPAKTAMAEKTVGKPLGCFLVI